MEALKAEMERKRKEREAAAPNAECSGKKRWVKRGDLEKARVQAYHESEASEAKEREARLVVP